jgi:hypothetical protein
MTADRKTGGEQLGLNERDLLKCFLKFGSVESVLSAYPDLNQHLSIATYQRLIDDRGVVKSPEGRPPVNFGALAEFFQTMIEEETTIRYLNKYPADGFNYSESTLFRVIKRIRNSDPKQVGTAIIAHYPGKPNMVLIGRDTCINSVDFNHNCTIPVTYSSRSESKYKSFMRVVQQEIASSLTIEGKLNINYPNIMKMVGGHIIPHFFLDVLDVRIGVCVWELPWDILTALSSERLDSMHFENIDTIANANPITSRYRAGVVDAVRLYQEKKLLLPQPMLFQSAVNKHLQESFATT